MDGSFYFRETSPSRLVRGSDARREFGPLAERLERALLEGDALADAADAELSSLDADARAAMIRRALAADAEVPRALSLLVEQTFATPEWVDLRKLELAGRVIRRGGLRSGLALAFRTLVMVYRSPGGTRPLALTGRFVDHAERRLYETAHFVLAMSQPGAFTSSGAARETAMQVRLLHARVRRGLERSPKWDSASWGRPLNQLDTLAMSLALSVTFVDGLEKLGAAVSEEEAEALAHLWAYVGQLLGVSADLAMPSLAQSRRALAAIELTQGAPNEVSRGLCKALIEGDFSLTGLKAERELREHRVAFFYELSRLLVGDEIADTLGFPRSRRWAAVARMVSGAPLGLPLEKLPVVGAMLNRLVDNFAAVMVARGLMETAKKSGGTETKCPFTRAKATLGKTKTFWRALTAGTNSGPMAWA